MNARLLVVVALLALPFAAAGCLYGRGPAGEMGNLALRSDCGLQALTSAGSLYLEKKEPNDAFIVFKRAVEIDPKSYDAQLGLAKACGELGEAKIGLNAAETAHALDPKQADPLIAAGRICFASWRFDEARKYLTEAVALDPKRAEAWRELGRVQGRQARREEGGSWTEAIRALQKACALEDQSAENHALLAEAYAEIGQLNGATDEYAKAVALDPKSADYPRNLAWLLIVQKKDLERARALALQSDKLKRGDGDALVAAAVALIRQGKTDEAIDELRSAIDKVSGNPDVYFFLAEAAAERGSREDYVLAASAWQYLQAAGVAPRHASVQDIRLVRTAIEDGIQKYGLGR